VNDVIEASEVIGSKESKSCPEKVMVDGGLKKQRLHFSARDYY
jgi:hypothetical protein